MKCLVLLVSLALALPIAAQAKTKKFSMTTICAVLMPCQPPPRYASGPFLEKPVIELVTLREIQTICGDYGARGDEGILGCAGLTPTSCIVHVPSDVKAGLPEVFRVILAHELAHCRGWVHAEY